MVIDIFFLLLLIRAIWQGYRRGLIVAVFSFLAILLGLAAAVKFSVVVSKWLEANTNIGTYWLPFISFIIVIMIVVILVKWIAKLIETSMEIVFLGWLNKLGGIILYAALYSMVFSVILFYATQMGLIKDELIHSSVTYRVIEPWGPKIIEGIGSVIPFFKNMFKDLQNFFSTPSSNIS